MMSSVWRCDTCRKHICRMCTEMTDGKPLCLQCGSICRTPGVDEIFKAKERQTGVMRKPLDTKKLISTVPPPPPPPVKFASPPGRAPESRAVSAAAAVSAAPASTPAAPAEGTVPVFLQRSGPFFCKNHPQVLATRGCEICKEFFCAPCVKFVEGNPICPLCSAKLKPLTREEQGLPPLPFSEEMKAAFAYPLKGDGRIILPVGAVFVWLLSFAGMRGTILGIGYMYAYMMSVCRTSAIGREAPPGWPSFTNWADDIAAPLFHVALARILSMAPALLYLFLLSPISPMEFFMGEEIPEAQEEITQADLEEELPEFALLRDPQANIDDVVRRNEIRKQGRVARKASLGPGAPFFILAALGLAYFPMALLALTLFRSYAVLNPLFVFSSASKIGKPYAFAYIILIIAEVAWLTAQPLNDVIPFFGSLLAYPVWIYVMMVEMRVMGLLYFNNEKRLAWFTREPVA